MSVIREIQRLLVVVLQSTSGCGSSLDIAAMTGYQRNGGHVTSVDTRRTWHRPNMKTCCDAKPRDVYAILTRRRVDQDTV